MKKFAVLLTMFLVLLVGALPALAAGDGTAATVPKGVAEAFNAQPLGWDYVLLSKADGIWFHRSWVRHVGDYYPFSFRREGNASLVPLRALAEFMGYQVDWESDSRTIWLTSTWPKGGAITTLLDIAVFDLDDHYVIVGSASRGLTVKKLRPIIIEGRTYVPLQFFLENLLLFPKQLEVIIDEENTILLRESSPG